MPRGAKPAAAVKATATELILAHNAGREPERLVIKYKTMRGTPFAFLRATSHVYYTRMRDAGVAPGGPPAWNSGDLHLENYGTYLGDNGLVYFDINDFDAGILAPAPWDILRQTTSVLIAAPTLAMKRSEVNDLARRMLEGYSETLLTGKARWIERRTADGVIGDLMQGLRRRDPVAFLDGRSKVHKGVRSLKIDGKKMLPVTPKELQALRAWLRAQCNGPDEKSFFDLIDAARRIAGVSSLGTPRYALLISGGGSPDGNLLLDLKSAQASTAAPFSPYPQPHWESEAHRIVAVQTRCQAVSPGLLRAVTYGGAPFVMRELQPSEDRLDLSAAAKPAERLANALHTMAELSAWGQLRSAGRQGSAPADDLVALGRDKGLAARLLTTAKQLEELVLADWHDYCASYDAGRFALAAAVKAGAVT